MKILTQMSVKIETVDRQPYSEDESIKNIQQKAVRHAIGAFSSLVLNTPGFQVVGIPKVTIVSITDENDGVCINDNADDLDKA